MLSVLFNMKNLMMGEREKLLQLDTLLSQRIVGQPEAVSAVW
jgi:ATP-dependent Clp protease ATP-binding subunit ClpA